MAGKKRNAPPSTNDITPRRSARAGARSRQSKNEAIPDVYREMLADARTETTAHEVEVSERPLKRKRPGEKPSAITKKTAVARNDNDDEDEDVEFEDVPLAPKPTIQTIVRDTDDEDDDDEIELEDVGIETQGPSASSAAAQPKTLTLNLSALMAAKSPQKGNRRKPATREEKERRVEIHKAHLICLLAHVELRNQWCNDPDVQDIL